MDVEPRVSVVFNSDWPHTVFTHVIYSLQITAGDMELEDFLEDVEMGVYCTAYNVFMSKTIEKGTHCTHLFYDRPVIV